MKKDIDSFVYEYKEYSSKYIKYFNDVYKKDEEDVKKLSKLNDVMRKDIEFAKKVIDRLISNENISTAVSISIMALEFNYRIEEALKKLKEVSENESYGFFCVYAKTYFIKYSKN